MSELRDHALQYARRGWRIFPVHTTVDGVCTCSKGPACPEKRRGKHPRTKSGLLEGTTDEAQIERWWRRWPNANIGVRTGSGLVVVDIDSADQEGLLKDLCGGRELPTTLRVTTGRGSHRYFRGHLEGSPTIGSTPERDGVLIRGEGGYVIVPPSWHVRGVHYDWVRPIEVMADLPVWFAELVQTTGSTKERVRKEQPRSAIDLGPRPEFLQKLDDESFTSRALLFDVDLLDRIKEALELLDPAMPMKQWIIVGMGLHSTLIGDVVFELWRDWSAGCDKKFKEGEPETRWRSFRWRPDGVSIGSVFDMVNRGEWLRPVPAKPDDPGDPDLLAQQFAPEVAAGFPGGADAPAGMNGHVLIPELTGGDQEVDQNGKRRLIDLNQRFSVINNMGGKCLVLSWINSEVGEGVLIPAFQTFKTFQERFGAKYIKVGHGEDQEAKKLGTHWLGWPHRREFEGLALAPGEPEKLPNGMLNLWRGFAVAPRAGTWDRMKEHVFRVVANGDTAAATYIFRFAAWAVQHPGERAEAALVLRGEEGTGKGTFAHAMRKIFGHHGLHVSDSKHLVGSFNAHLRHCLWLYADEAFWAGNKQGESVLKALITEPTIMIEQKGVDAVAWRNRFHVCMTANADWVVPAGPGARRYMVVDVSSERRRDRAYFAALHEEMQNGGLGAMLHDLLCADLGDWHPRDIVETEALRRQKELSMSPLWSWWENVLQDAILPFDRTAPLRSREVTAQATFNAVRDAVGLAREANYTAIGRFLRAQGCVKTKRTSGNSWVVPPISEARARFAMHMRGWIWRENHTDWVDLDAKPSNSPETIHTTTN